MGIRRVIEYFFFFPGIFLHEFSHFLVAFLSASRIDRFNIFPRIEGNRIIYGSVYTAPRLQVFQIPISLAPVVLWVWCYFLLSRLGYLELSIEPELIFRFDYLSFFSLDNLWLHYLALQLLWGGIPSREDFKNAFLALFAPSSLVVIAVIVGILFFAVNFD